MDVSYVLGTNLGFGNTDSQLGNMNGITTDLSGTNNMQTVVNINNGGLSGSLESNFNSQASSSSAFVPNPNEFTFNEMSSSSTNTGVVTDAKIEPGMNGPIVSSTSFTNEATNIQMHTDMIPNNVATDAVTGTSQPGIVDWGLGSNTGLSKTFMTEANTNTAFGTGSTQIPSSNTFDTVRSNLFGSSNEGTMNAAHFSSTSGGLVNNLAQTTNAASISDGTLFSSSTGGVVGNDVQNIGVTNAASDIASFGTSSRTALGTLPDIVSQSMPGPQTSNAPVSFSKYMNY